MWKIKWGKNGNLHTIFHVSHTCTPGSESIWHLIFERNYFFLPPRPPVSLCHGTRSTALIFLSANATWSVNRATATGKPEPNINIQDTAPLSSLWKCGNCRAAGFVLLQTVVISVTESSAQRQEVHGYLTLPSLGFRLGSSSVW